MKTWAPPTRRPPSPCKETSSPKTSKWFQDILPAPRLVKAPDTFFGGAFPGLPGIGVYISSGARGRLFVGDLRLSSRGHEDPQPDTNPSQLFCSEAFMFVGLPKEAESKKALIEGGLEVWG